MNIECQCIYGAQNSIPNEENNLPLFVASISLARLFHDRYCFQKYDQIKIHPSENQEVYLAIQNILKIIALCVILDMKDPFIFTEEQLIRDE